MNIWNLFQDLYQTFVLKLTGKSGVIIRRKYYAKKFKAYGENIVIGENIKVVYPENISLGNEFSCWRNCVLVADKASEILIGNKVGFNQNVYVNTALGTKIHIGNHVMIGPNVVIRASKHVTKSVDTVMQNQGHEHCSIVIEDDVWIAAGVVICGNIKIGKGCIIGANSVVTSDLPEYTFCVGAPAKVKSFRKSL